jgi:PST family polysaccharide transporter
MSYGTRNVDSLLVGWQLGAVPLGIYNQAYRLLLLPLLQVTLPLGTVILPTLSRVKDDAARFRGLFRQAVELVAGPGMAVVAVLFCAADEVVRVGLGPQWVESVPIFRVLAIGAWVGTFNQITYWAVISLGEVRRMFRQQLVLAPIYWLSFAIGLHWGVIGVAAAVSLVAVAAVPASVLYCFRGTAVGLGDLGRAVLAPSLATAVAVALGSLVASWLSPAAAPLLRLVVIAGVAGVAFVAAWLAFLGSRARVVAALRLLRERRVAEVEPEVAP